MAGDSQVSGPAPVRHQGVARGRLLSGRPRWEERPKRLHGTGEIRRNARQGSLVWCGAELLNHPDEQGEHRIGEDLSRRTWQDFRAAWGHQTTS